MDAKMNSVLAVCWAAAQGDINELRRLVAAGVDLNKGDYDGRTGLHLAASEGRLDAIKFFIAKRVNLSPKDRFGGTPLIDARRGDHKQVIALLEKSGVKE